MLLALSGLRSDYITSMSPQKSHRADQEDSRYPDLDEFKYVPSAGAEWPSNLTAAERLTIQSLDEGKQMMRWLISATEQNHQTAQDLDKRLREIEEWKESVWSRATLLGASLLFIFPMVVAYLIEKYAKK